MVTGGEIAASAAAKQITATFGQVFDSPSKEIGNYIADKIRYLRYQSLLRIVTEAEKKAKAKNLNLKMPPIKFFVPFCEAASLEEPDEKNSIRELWENLLVSASEIQDAEQLLFVRILQQIGSREADFIVELVEAGRAKTYAMMASRPFPEDARYFSERNILSLIRALPMEFDLDYLSELIVDVSECPGILFDEVNVRDAQNEISSIFDHTVSNRREIPAGILISLGLVERLSFEEINPLRFSPSLTICLEGYRLTPVGIRFYKSCSGRNFKKEFIRTVSYERYQIDFLDWLLSRKN